MKLSLEDIQSALNKVDVEQEKKIKVLQELQQIIEENKNNAAPVNKTKNEFGVVIFDKNHELDNKEFTACVYQIKEGDKHDNVLHRLSDASREQNEFSKKKNNLIKTMGEAFGYLKRKFVKDRGILIKTKIPIVVLISHNDLV